MTAAIFMHAVSSAHVGPEGVLVSPSLFREPSNEKAFSRKLTVDESADGRRAGGT